MKCIERIHIKLIVRETDEKAAELMRKWPRDYRYAPKSAWKAQKAAEAARKAEG